MHMGLKAMAASGPARPAACLHRFQQAGMQMQSGVYSQAAQMPTILSVRRSSRVGAVRRQQSAFRVQPVAAGAASSQSQYVGSPIARPEQRYAIVVARFNELVTRLLLAGAVDAFERHGLPSENIEASLGCLLGTARTATSKVAWVPGSYELPVVASAMARSGQFDAVVCIGTVVRGATTHYEAVAGGATNGVLDVSRSTGVPTIFGVLTTETMEQAQDRAGGKTGNKGAEAAVTAIEMANVLQDLRVKGLAAGPWGIA